MSNEQYSRTKKKLLAEKPKEQYDVWEIRGEDPNCDMGGHHHMPRLMTLRSTYEEAVDIALSLPQFFQWGSGGDVRPIVIMTVEQVSDIPNLRKRKAQLESELRVINKTLGV